MNEGKGVVRTADYPAGPMRRGEQGTAIITFRVQPDGRVADCAIKRSSGSSELDTASCALFVHRARFTPQPDSSGLDRRTVPVNWRLPR